MSFDVTLVTYERLPDGGDDDQLLARALAATGARARFAVWSDPSVDWSASPVTILRSTWDYFHRVAEFAAWLGLAASQTRLVNPHRVLRWNMDKRYLADLEVRGVPVVPTLFVRKGETVDLAALCADRGWSEVVVKPTISGGAFGTKRFATGQIANEAAAHLAGLTETREAMIQPYLAAVETERERSLVFLGGGFSHAFLKSPFGIDYSASVPHPPSDQELAFGHQVLEAVGEPVAYARVDIVPSAPGPLLMELEVIEPNLLMGLAPGSAERLANLLLGYSGRAEAVS
ncbi:RimK family alpha-L-glutamate ligase [Phenylobacterium sp.]|uniref:ATP-grasp domain-containing protein n=1 Tax=Phenylobacterium sp. TaxID=1871053 RepID=UPI0027371DFF|nr:transporter [Phenylobacterium sp.]MDP3853009.1 transporter [Phenylobacterium sp.]